jgi:hypothetical protein
MTKNKIENQNKGDEKMKTLKLALAFLTLLFFSNIASAQRSDQTTSEAYDVDNVQTVSGEITEVNHPIAKMKGDDGNEYEIHMGPFWYWDQNQYKLQHQVRAQVKGEVKQVQGRYEFYPWEITQEGKTMTFADDNGVPKWSKGKGMRHGNGYGKGYGRGKGKCKRWNN